MLATTVHALAGAAASVYILFHIGHHAIALAQPTETAAAVHKQIQQAVMPRGASEILFIFVPTGLAWASGAYLLARRGLANNFSSFGKLFRHFSSPAPLTDQSAFVAIRQTQIASAVVFGAFLLTHTSAVLVLRAARGEPISIDGASHSLHDPKLTVVGQALFAAYYAVFVASFFTHGASSVAMYSLSQEKEAQTKKEQEGQAEKARVSARFWWRRIVLPVAAAGLALGSFIVMRAKSSTTLESTRSEWPF
jgi:hypothetical protein